MRELPCLIFSSSELCEDIGVSDALPEKPDLKSLRHLFFSALKRARGDFLAFCDSPAEDGDYRIYPLEALRPFRAAFCEKSRILATDVTVVFLAQSVTAFSRCMSPSARRCASAVDRMLFELLYLRDGGAPAFSSLSPELFLVVSRIPTLASAFLSRRCGMRPCDLGDLLGILARTMRERPFAGRIDIRLNVPECGEDRIADVPVEALAVILAALCSVLSHISEDGTVLADVTGRGDAAEVSLRTRCGHLDLPEDGGLELLFRLPQDYRDAVKIAVVLSVAACIDASIRVRDGGICISVLAGLKALLPPDFKFSDPTGAVSAAAAEILAVLS